MYEHIIFHLKLKLHFFEKMFYEKKNMQKNAINNII